MRKGYCVYWRPDGEESGTLFYEEGDKRLEFDVYFYKGEKFAPIVAVPSNGQWKQVMPDWVKNRKDEVVLRMRKHFRWKIEDTTDLSKCWWREGGL